MRATRTPPNGVERSFEPHEMIVTKTDPRGVIVYANDVFLRISALTEADAIGQPHNIVRHPDMPRAVFKLLWDTLAERKEIFAYVLNLAADGAHYWVFAHVTPTFGSGGKVVGYHSTRRRPESAAVASISRCYQQIRAAECARPGSPEALDAGCDLLREILDDRGQSYDEFVWELTTQALG